MKASARRLLSLAATCLALGILCAPSSALAGSNLKVLKSWNYPGTTNRLFVGAAVGDFNDDAVAEIALVKRAHSQVLILRSAADPDYETMASFNVDLTNSELIDVAAGNLDGKKGDELIVLRRAPSSGVSNLLVYQFGTDTDWSSNLIAQVHIDTVSTWKGVAAGDFNGDGRADIAVASEGTNSRIQLYELSTSNTLVFKGNRGWIGNVPLTSIAAGDLDADGRAEIVVARQASDTAKDFLFFKVDGSTSWLFRAAGEFNLNGGTTHYPWAGVAVGEFDRDTTNGKEVVFYKTVSQNFHYLKYSNATTTPVAIGSESHGSDFSNPWTGVAAGDAILSNGYDELVLVSQKQNATNLAMVGDVATVHGIRADSLQRGGFHFGTVYQEVPQLRTPEQADLNLSAALDVPKLKRFLENNHIPAFTFQIADYWNLNSSGQVSTPGREYRSLVEFLDLLKRTNSPIKVTVLLTTRLQSSERAYIAPMIGDSELIGSAELAGEISGSDESALFDRVDGDPALPDEEDYRSWFTLLGIIGKKYPNLAGITIDDFGSQAGPGRFFSPRIMGKLVTGLRKYSDRIAFMPVMYIPHARSNSKRVLRDYTDGFVFYTRNEDTVFIDNPAPEPDKYISDKTRLPPDVENCDDRGQDNLHGAIVLGTQAIAGGRGYDISQIAEFRNWMNNDHKFLMQGIYAYKVTRSSTLPTPFTVGAQLDSARASFNLDGIFLYKTQDPTVTTCPESPGCPSPNVAGPNCIPPSVMAPVVYGRFASWFLVDDYFNLGTNGSTPNGWTVTAAANTSCVIQADPFNTGDKRLMFTDNNTSGAAAARKNFTSQTGTLTAQWQFMQAAHRPQYMYLRQGDSNFAVQILTDSSGRLYYRPPSGADVLLQSFSANTWTALKVVVDIAQNRFDVYVNGTLRAEDAPFTVPVTSLDNVYFTTSGGTGNSTYTHYIDAVSITQ